MDFFTIRERKDEKKGEVDVYADFTVGRSKDIMVRGGAFYAIWDPETNLWSTDEYDVPRMVDAELAAHKVNMTGVIAKNVMFLANFSSRTWLQFRSFINHLSDSSVTLDEKLIFANTEVKKEDYASKRLPYSLEPGDFSAWDELVGILYSPDERAKIEWAIGAILSGDSKTIQKFLIFYGKGGTGKSTVINVIEKLFEGYTAKFDAKRLTGLNNTFATDVFRTNPHVAIQHDGDLSKIEDNTMFNSIVSHEWITMNEKFKSSYEARVNAMCIIGSNKPVKITDAKSGLIRRVIDVHPTGDKVSPRKYQVLVSKIDFELGAIASHCLEVYHQMGKDYYDGYIPTEMMLQTDVFFNFIEASYDVFARQDSTTLDAAYAMWKQFADYAGLEWKMPLHKFREELRNYFDEFEDRATLEDGTTVKSWYTGFKAAKFKTQVRDDMVFSLVLDEKVSLLDDRYAKMPAQYANSKGLPIRYWSNKPKDRDGEEYIPKDSEIVSTVRSELNTSREHYTKVPENDIVIDFDLTDEYGAKSLEKNLEAASQWPSTYAELSKSGEGIHLHYEWTGGDVELLNRVYEPGIEVKVFTGDQALRRRLTKCNNIEVAKLSSGLAKKEKQKVDDEKQEVKSEKSLRELILRNLRKEIMPGTKPSMDFINKILNDAYRSGLKYDVTDMRNSITAFANSSTHQALYCLKLVQNMKFKSVDADAPVARPDTGSGKDAFAKNPLKDPSTAEGLVFFDVEVFPNLFVICWKGQGSKSVVRMINPTAQQVEELLSLKLVGFNNRRYDNHILYAAVMGYTNADLYKLSQRIVNNVPGTLFGEAFNISYCDIFEFSSKKQSLKKFEIELGIPHVELGLPWDEDAPEALWEKIADYCANDVEATEATFEARKQDFIARQILSELSGLSINSTTQQHTAKIVFGNDRNPRTKFVYTDLSETFPGYVFDHGKSTYKDEEVGEGGYVYAEPGMYENVAVLDVASMHPTSIEELNMFGEYTKNFSDLKNARVAIKRGHFDDAKLMLGGALAPYLTDESQAKDLSYALKIVINIVYGLTAARFDSIFRDPKNIDNIVAKRGALFMVDLKLFVQSKGFQVIHIKTDSIKIPNATKEIIELVMEFGQNYGYEFEHEATYDKMALVNNAVYIAKVNAGRGEGSHWEATGAEFQQPYIYKKLFTKEEITFKDLCEAKNVQKGALYLDFGDNDAAMALSKPGMHFVGKTGLFTPVKKEAGGALLMRVDGEKQYAVTGTKGYHWLESEMVQALEKEDDIDMEYFRNLAKNAILSISEFGDFKSFAEMKDISEFVTEQEIQDHLDKIYKKRDVEYEPELMAA